jgi:hypothetical protein
MKPLTVRRGELLRVSFATFEFTDAFFETIEPRTNGGKYCEFDVDVVDDFVQGLKPDAPRFIHTPHEADEGLVWVAALGLDDRLEHALNALAYFFFGGGLTFVAGPVGTAN